MLEILVGFGVAGLQPIPVIILAQALNGILLPLVAVFLVLAVNDRSLMGDEGLSTPLHTVFMGAVVAVTLVLGLSNLSRAAVRATGLPALPESWLIVGSALVAAAIAVPVVRSIRRARRFSDE